VSFKILDGQRVKLRLGTNTALGELDDALGDNFGERVGAIYKTKGLAGVRERRRHFLDNVRLKGLVVQKRSDRHWHLTDAQVSLSTPAEYAPLSCGKEIKKDAQIRQ
jgi:hypothetical protein